MGGFVLVLPVLEVLAGSFGARRLSLPGGMLVCGKGRDGLKQNGSHWRRGIANDRSDSGLFLGLWDEFQRNEPQPDPRLSEPFRPHFPECR